MKLLFTIHYPTYGGPHNQAARLDGLLQAHGWSTTVLLPDERGNSAKRLRESGIEVVQMRLHRLRASLDPRLHLGLLAGLPTEVARIRKLIRRENIDLVVVAGLANPHAAIASRLEKVPVVWQFLDCSTPKLASWALLPLVARLADSVMFAGHAVSAFHRHQGVARLPGYVFYPPVPTQTFQPSQELRNQVRKRLGVPADAFLVGTVANLTPRKGIEHFIRAAALIHRVAADTWFVVVGDTMAAHGAYADRMRSEVAKSGLPIDRFIFTGGRNDVHVYYPALDVKLISSLSEGTPTTAIEAMACGVPVITFDVGGVSEPVLNGITGFVVAPRREELLADSVLVLHRDRILRRRMGELGRRRAVEHFDVENCASVHLRAFQAARVHHAARLGPGSVKRRLTRPTDVKSVESEDALGRDP